MRGAQALAAEELDEFIVRFLAVLQFFFEDLLRFRVLFDFAPGLIVAHIRVSLNFPGIVVGIERTLDDFEVLHKLERDCVAGRIEAGGARVVDFQKYSEVRSYTRSWE